MAAVRAGSHALAVGNLLGSHCSNMFILVALDALDREPSLLASISAGVALSAVFASLMMGMVLLDTLKRSESRIWSVEPAPALIVLTYARGVFLTYGQRTEHEPAASQVSGHGVAAQRSSRPGS